MPDNPRNTGAVVANGVLPASGSASDNGVAAPVAKTGRRSTQRRPTPGVALAASALAWLAGVALQLQQSQAWPAAHYVAVIGLGALAALALMRTRRFARCLPLCGAAVAFGVTGWHAAHRLDQTLASNLEGVDLQLTGIVSSLPQAVAAGVRFRFEVERALQGARTVDVPRNLMLAGYRGRDDDALSPFVFDALEAGQRWQLVARLKRPHGHANPHGFDHELSLFEQGIRATGTVRIGRGDLPNLLDANARWDLDRWRQRVRNAIERRVPDPRAAGVLAALAIGDQNAIEREDWTLFRDTGVAHLMSISGLHVTMFAWIAAGIIGRLWRSDSRLPLRMPASAAARWGGVACALGYAAFAGWGVPAQRTVWMLLTAAWLTSSGRRWPWPLVLLAAGAVVSALDPWALLQPGFWLSFAAVGLLLASVSPRAEADSDRTAGRPAWHRALAPLRDGLRTQSVVTLGLTPLSLVFFHQVSVVGVVANLVAIPVVTLVVTPLSLLGIAFPALWSAGAAAIEGLTALLAWMATWPQSVWTVGAAPAWCQAAGVLAGVIAVVPLPWRIRLLALPLALPLLWPVIEWPADGEFRAIAADVGQGTAVIVRTRERWLLYDAGPQYSSETDAGQRVLVPLLRALGARRLDALVLSHRDADHVGGAAAVMRAFPVRTLSSSLEQGHPLLAEPTAQAVRCEAGQAWTWDGVRFEMLHPDAPAYDRAGKPNAVSCVLRISGPHGSLLLTGDIEREQELALVAREGERLASDAILVPHHGSRTSSTAPLLDAVRPTVAIVQAGHRNRFGHPRPDVVARYRERDAIVIDTAACGAYTWWAMREPRRPTCQRELNRRYWHQHVPAASG